jgi:ABC-type Fe3+-siderophore transport system permease subunit
MDYVIIRFLSAILTGVILSQTGSYMQLSTRNLLASPSTLGFDGLSILWMLLFHSLLLFFGLEYQTSFYFLLGIPFFTLIGWVFSKNMGQSKSIERLILMGLTFNLLVGAVFSLWQFLFLAFNLPFPVELWFGHFRFAEKDSLLILITVEAFLLGGMFWLKKEFYLFSLGKSIANNYHYQSKKLFTFLFIAVAIGTFAVVSQYGAFSFLGLIFPILARKLWFKKFDLVGEFVLGSLCNGIFLMIIDSICYHFPIYGAEIPVGLIATGVGALSLICLLWNSSMAKTKK